MTHPLDAATQHLDPPFAAVDLDAFDANAADLLRRARGKPVRLASKSLRCRTLAARAHAAGFRGTLAFTLREALWLDEDDVVVAYPTTDRAALRALAAAPEKAAVMVDCREHLDLLDGPLRVWIDVDASWRPLGGRVRIGARRSPLHTPAAAAALAREVVARSLRLEGLMMYEAQIAGVGDRPGNALVGAAIRRMQRASARELADRRAAVVQAVQAVAPLRYVNGGGTGSVEQTAAEAAVTEVAAGSGCSPRRCSTPTARSRRAPPRSSRSRSCAGRRRAWRPRSAAATRPPAPPAATGSRARPPGSGSTRAKAPARSRRRCSAATCASATACGCGTPRPASCASASTCSTSSRGGELVETVPTYRGEGKTFL